MDIFTESEMPISMTLQGGIGIIDYNNSIREQIQLNDRVKRYENAFITDPKTLSTQHTVTEAVDIKNSMDLWAVQLQKTAV